MRPYEAGPMYWLLQLPYLKKITRFPVIQMVLFRITETPASEFDSKYKNIFLIAR